MNEVNKITEVYNTQYRRIVVSKDNYRKLKERGLAGDSFNDVITEMLKKIDSLQQSSTGVGAPNEIVVNSEHSFKEKDCP